MDRQDFPLKLGKINFLNVFPIYYALEKGIIRHPFQIIYGTPSELNEIASSQNLIASAVSSVEYGRHFDHYFLIPNLSISAAGKVESVLLFSRYPVTELSNLPVLLSKKSLSSSFLLKLLFEKKWRSKPHYVDGKLAEGTLFDRNIAAILAIGDDALIIKKREIFPYVIDLGESWHEWTGKPFVFGVWVINRKMIPMFNGYIETACETLLKSKEYGLHNLNTIAHEAAKFGILPPGECLEYFRRIDYNFKPLQLEGMKLFFNYLVETGMLPEMPEICFYEETEANE